METGPSGEGCFICGEDSQERLQTHHIVPRRYGGSDNPENLVTLCAGCHQAIEHLYDDAFYHRLKIKSSDFPIDDLEFDGLSVDEKQSPDRRLDPRNAHVTMTQSDGFPIVESANSPDEYDEIHCGYCSTKFESHQHAQAARHLRVKHRIDDPYKLNTVSTEELYPESRNRPTPWG